MKMTKKVFSAIALATVMTVSAIPATATKVEAAVTPIAGYNFEGGTGMSSTGFGTAPTVVHDSDRDSDVLQFAAGASSKLLTRQQDSSLGEYDMKIETGSPSSLKFNNPFKGKNLSGATISLWVKVPDDTACEEGAGLVGFVSGSKTIEHPDKATGDPDKQSLEPGTGPFLMGLSCAYIDPVGDAANPLAYFAGLHHNTYNLNDNGGVFLGVGGKWQYITLTMNNSSMTLYVNGAPAGDMEQVKNKRWNDGEVNGGTAGNVGQTKLLEFLAWSDTEAYVGYTGFTPTTANVCIDELTFYDKELSASEVSSLYQAAQAGDTTTGASGSSSSSASAAAAKQAAAAEAAAAAAAAEAAAQAKNHAMTDALIASLQVDGMPSTATKTVTPIYRGESGYASMQSSLNGVILRDGYRLNDFVAMDISYGGQQPKSVATLTMDVPEGYDTSTLVVARINDDGTVSILKHSIENGKIVVKTNHFTKYAVVNLEPGTPGSSSANLPKTGTVAGGVVAGVGVISVLAGVVLLRRKKEVFE